MSKPSKTIEEKYKKLDDIEHCLLRPGRYLGSVNPHTANTYILNEENKFEKREITWCPALIKTFDEIISNSVDFSKTFEGQHLNTIKVEIDQEKGEISVWDNGGIVVVKNKDFDQYVPEMIFELKAGSNFDDDDDSTLTGQNGEGAALTVIFSKEFTVRTSDGKNQFIQTHTENARKKTEPKISASNKNFTNITWTPDYTRFNLNELDEGNYQKLIKRVYDVAGCNPNLKIYLNGKHIKINSFDDYVSMYSDNYAYDENDNWKIAIGKAEEGFEHITFVNGTETLIGGTHINYISDQIISKLREYFKKKHKVEVKPSDIKNHLQLFINATIVKPRYSSQTKDELISEVKSYNTSWECNDKFIKKILSLDVIQSVLDWVQAKEQAQLNSELRKLNKNLDKANPKKIPKFHDATSKNRRETSIFFVEGDSALSPILNSRDPRLHAAFPLRGRPINVYEMTAKDVMENKEFKSILTILGLQLGVEVTSADDIRFGKIVFTTDQDVFGFSIRGLLMNMLYKFWPELFEMGLIYILDTPIVKVTIGKKIISFYSIEEYKNWIEHNHKEKFTSKYFKGLGTTNSKDFKEYFKDEIMDKCLSQIIIEDNQDREMFRLLFSKEKGMTDQRKEWMDIEDKTNKELIA